MRTTARFEDIYVRRVFRAGGVVLVTGGVVGAYAASSRDMGALLLVPVMLAGLWFGRVGGMAAGTVEILLLAGVGKSSYHENWFSLDTWVARLGAFVAAGFLVGWIVDERRRALRSEAHLRLAPDCFITVDQEGRILQLNRAAERTFGIGTKDVVGRRLADVIMPARSRVQHRLAFRRWVEETSDEILPRVNLTAVRGNGAEFPAELSLSRLRDSGPGRLCVYVRDLTQVAGTEEQRDSLLSLERQAREAADAARRSSRKLAADALEAEERERQRISQALHDDAVQPLLAASQDLREATRGDLDAVERATGIIDGTVSRLREAVFELHPVVMELGGLETALRAVAGSYARRGNFHVEVRIESDPGGRHQQLLLSVAREFLANAARHAAAHRVLVRVAARGNRVLLEVKDDGLGMDASRPEAAFREGHIGLASSRERVTALGGRLEIESRPGHGTTARVLLPPPSPLPEASGLSASSGDGASTPRDPAIPAARAALRPPGG